MSSRTRSQIGIFCPGKINWSLVAGQRGPQGYHALRTLMQYVQFGDWLQVEGSATEGEIGLETNVCADLPTANNLVYRAATQLQKAAGKHYEARLVLTKQLPIGSGLGGGSSDAAMTLMALNRIWALNWPKQRLMDVARTLGSDVPFFLFGRSAYASGRGEKLTTARGLTTLPVLITWTGPALLTAEVFRAFAQQAPHPLPRGMRTRALKKHLLTNLLLETVCRLNPRLAELHAILNAYSPTGMTGTGNALFTPCDTWQLGQYLRSQLPPGVSSSLTMTCNYLPTFPHYE